MPEKQERKHWNGPTLAGIKREWRQIKWPSPAKAAKEVFVVTVLSMIVSLGIAGVDNAILAVFNMFLR